LSLKLHPKLYETSPTAIQIFIGCTKLDIIGRKTYVIGKDVFLVNKLLSD